MFHNQRVKGIQQGQPKGQKISQRHIKGKSISKSKFKSGQEGSKRIAIVRKNAWQEKQGKLGKYKGVLKTDEGLSSGQASQVTQTGQNRKESTKGNMQDKTKDNRRAKQKQENWEGQDTVGCYSQDKAKHQTKSRHMQGKSWQSERQRKYKSIFSQSQNAILKLIDFYQKEF